MLLQIRDFIQRERVVSSQQLVREFQLDEMALQPMLRVWLEKGIIQECQQSASCGSTCSGCATSVPRFYQVVCA